MTTETPLDRAWATATAPLAGDAEMARFYDIFAATELFLLIDSATLDGGGAPKPMLFPVDGGDTALVFDTEDRLASFVEDGGAHLTLSGRAVITMFAGGGVQLGLNLGDAPSATILPAAAVDWAAEALRQPIETTEIGDALLTVPTAVMPDLLQALDGKLAAMGAVVGEAWLCGFGSAGRGKAQPMVLCVALREQGAEQSVVSALAETARFAGGEASAFDIAVLGPDDPRMEAARKVGLGFEPQDPAELMHAEPAAAPGMDPSKPPKLR